MIWVVDKIVVQHLLSQENQLAQIPLRISFEFAVEAGAVVDGSISLKVLYNAGLVRRRSPQFDKETVAVELRNTAYSAVIEHLAFSGLKAKPESDQSVEIDALDTYFSRISRHN